VQEEKLLLLSYFPELLIPQGHMCREISFDPEKAWNTYF
jgi:hypothetical protein